MSPWRSQCTQIVFPSAQVHLARPTLQDTTAAAATDRGDTDDVDYSNPNDSEINSDEQSSLRTAADSSLASSSTASQAEQNTHMAEDANNEASVNSSSHETSSSSNFGTPDDTGTNVDVIADNAAGESVSNSSKAQSVANPEADDVGAGDMSADSFDWIDNCDSTVCTLVVQKGQQQQELLVSGGITRQQLTDEVQRIVSSLSVVQDQD